MGTLFDGSNLNDQERILNAILDSLSGLGGGSNTRHADIPSDAVYFSDGNTSVIDENNASVIRAGVSGKRKWITHGNAFNIAENGGETALINLRAGSTNIAQIFAMDVSSANQIGTPNVASFSFNPPLEVEAGADLNGLAIDLPAALGAEGESLVFVYGYEEA